MTVRSGRPSSRPSPHVVRRRPQGVAPTWLLGAILLLGVSIAVAALATPALATPTPAPSTTTPAIPPAPQTTTTDSHASTLPDDGAAAKATSAGSFTVIDSQGKTLFYHLDASDARAELFGLIYFSLWFGALLWDVLSTASFDVVLVRETKWRCLPSALHSLAFLASRYVTLVWLGVTVCNIVGVMDNCEPRMVAASVLFGASISATTLLFVLRAIAIWNVEWRVTTALSLGWLHVVAWAILICFTSEARYFPGSQFCTYSLGLPRFYGIWAAVVIVDLLCLILTIAKLNRSGLRTLLVGLLPELQPNIDSESITLVVLQRTTAFFAVKFALLLSCVAVYAATDKVAYRLAQVVAGMAVSASLAGRLFRKAWRMTRQRHRNHMPPQYSDRWARTTKVEGTRARGVAHGPLDASKGSDPEKKTGGAQLEVGAQIQGSAAGETCADRAGLAEQEAGGEELGGVGDTPDGSPWTGSGGDHHLARLLGTADLDSRGYVEGEFVCLRRLSAVGGRRASKPPLLPGPMPFEGDAGASGLPAARSAVEARGHGGSLADRYARARLEWMDSRASAALGSSTKADGCLFRQELPWDACHGGGLDNVPSRRGSRGSGTGAGHKSSSETNSAIGDAAQAYHQPVCIDSYAQGMPAMPARAALAAPPSGVQVRQAPRQSEGATVMLKGTRRPSGPGNEERDASGAAGEGYNPTTSASDERADLNPMPTVSRLWLDSGAARQRRERASTFSSGDAYGDSAVGETDIGSLHSSSIGAEDVAAATGTTAIGISFAATSDEATHPKTVDRGGGKRRAKTSAGPESGGEVKPKTLMTSASRSSIGPSTGRRGRAARPSTVDGVTTSSAPNGGLNSPKSPSSGGAAAVTPPYVASPALITPAGLLTPRTERWTYDVDAYRAAVSHDLAAGMRGGSSGGGGVGGGGGATLGGPSLTYSPSSRLAASLALRPGSAGSSNHHMHHHQPVPSTSRSPQISPQKPAGLALSSHAAASVSSDDDVGVDALHAFREVVEADSEARRLRSEWRRAWSMSTASDEVGEERPRTSRGATTHAHSRRLSGSGAESSPSPHEVLGHSSSPRTPSVQVRPLSGRVRPSSRREDGSGSGSSSGSPGCGLRTPPRSDERPATSHGGSHVRPFGYASHSGGPSIVNPGASRQRFGAAPSDVQEDLGALVGARSEGGKEEDAEGEGAAHDRGTGSGGGGNDVEDKTLCAHIATHAAALSSRPHPSGSEDSDDASPQPTTLFETTPRGEPARGGERVSGEGFEAMIDVDTPTVAPPPLLGSPAGARPTAGQGELGSSIRRIYQSLETAANRTSSDFGAA